jgi:hypothetical protein
VSLCLRCGAPLEFDAALAPRWLTYDEVRRLPLKQREQLVQVLVGIVTLRPGLVVDRRLLEQARAQR